MEAKFRQAIRPEDYKEVDEYDQRYAIEKVGETLESLANQVSMLDSEIEGGKRDNVSPDEIIESITGSAEKTIGEYFEEKIKNINNGFRLFDNANIRQNMAEILNATELHVQKVLYPNKFAEHTLNSIIVMTRSIEKLISQDVDNNDIDKHVVDLQRSLISLNEFKRKRKLTYSPDIQSAVRGINKTLRYFGKVLLEA